MRMPKFIKKRLLWLWRKWLPIAQVIGNFQAQVIMTVFYTVLFLPLGVIMTLIADPLKLRLAKSKNRTSFVRWEFPKETLKSARKQY